MSGGPATRRVLVIVPAWNEQDSIGGDGRTRSSPTNPTVDVLVVDDGSGDRTAARAAAAGATVCRLPFNLGVGGAMRTGYRYAAAVTATTSPCRSTPTASTTRATSPACSPSSTRRRGHRRPVRRPDDPYTRPRPPPLGDGPPGSVLSRLARTRLTDVTSGFRASQPPGHRASSPPTTPPSTSATPSSPSSSPPAPGAPSPRCPSTMRPRTAGQASALARTRRPSTSSAPSWRWGWPWSATGPPSFDEAASRRNPRRPAEGQR